MKIARKIIGIYRQFNNNLICNYPFIWETKIFQLIIFSIVLSFFAFLSSFLIPINFSNLGRNYDISTIKFIGDALSIILALIFLVFWIKNVSKYRIKYFSWSKSLKELIIYFIGLLMLWTATNMFSLGLNIKINNLTITNEDKLIPTLRKNNFFLPFYIPHRDTNKLHDLPNYFNNGDALLRKMLDRSLFENKHYYNINEYHHTLNEFDEKEYYHEPLEYKYSTKINQNTELNLTGIDSILYNYASSIQYLFTPKDESPELVDEIIRNSIKYKFSELLPKLVRDNYFSLFSSNKIPFSELSRNEIDQIFTNIDSFSCYAFLNDFEREMSYYQSVAAQRNFMFSMNKQQKENYLIIRNKINSFYNNSLPTFKSEYLFMNSNAINKFNKNHNILDYNYYYDLNDNNEVITGPSLFSSKKITDSLSEICKIKIKKMCDIVTGDSLKISDRYNAIIGSLSEEGKQNFKLYQKSLEEISNVYFESPNYYFWTLLPLDSFNNIENINDVNSYILLDHFERNRVELMSRYYFKRIALFLLNNKIVNRKLSKKRFENKENKNFISSDSFFGPDDLIEYSNNRYYNNEIIFKDSLGNTFYVNYSKPIEQYIMCVFLKLCHDFEKNDNNIADNKYPKFKFDNLIDTINLVKSFVQSSQDSFYLNYILSGVVNPFCYDKSVEKTNSEFYSENLDAPRYRYKSFNLYSYIHDSFYKYRFETSNDDLYKFSFPDQYIINLKLQDQDSITTDKSYFEYGKTPSGYNSRFTFYPELTTLMTHLYMNYKEENSNHNEVDEVVNLLNKNGFHITGNYHSKINRLFYYSREILKAYRYVTESRIYLDNFIRIVFFNKSVISILFFIASLFFLYVSFDTKLISKALATSFFSVIILQIIIDKIIASNLKEPDNTFPTITQVSVYVAVLLPLLSGLLGLLIINRRRTSMFGFLILVSVSNTILFLTIYSKLYYGEENIIVANTDYSSTNVTKFDLFSYMTLYLGTGIIMGAILLRRNQTLPERIN
jgi:hypothetical protein